MQENINISARRHHAWGGFWINQKWEGREREAADPRHAGQDPVSQQAIMNLGRRQTSRRPFWGVGCRKTCDPAR